MGPLLKTPFEQSFWSSRVMIGNSSLAFVRHLRKLPGIDNPHLLGEWPFLSGYILEWVLTPFWWTIVSSGYPWEGFCPVSECVCTLRVIMPTCHHVVIRPQLVWQICRRVLYVIRLLIGSGVIPVVHWFLSFGLVSPQNKVWVYLWFRSVLCASVTKGKPSFISFFYWVLWQRLIWRNR